MSSRHFSFWTSEDIRGGVLVSGKRPPVVRTDFFDPPCASTFFSCSDNIDYIATTTSGPRVSYAFPALEAPRGPVRIEMTVRIPVPPQANGVYRVVLHADADADMEGPGVPFTLALTDDGAPVATHEGELSPPFGPATLVLQCPVDASTRLPVAARQLAVVATCEIPEQPEYTLDEAVLFGRLEVQWTI